MNEELIKNAMKMFDTSAKWHAFLELVNQSDNIRDCWWRILKEEVHKRELEFNKENPDWDWDIRSFGICDIRWLIRGKPENSLMIQFHPNFLRVFYNGGYLDVNKVNQLIIDQRFDIIKTCFDRIDGSNWETIGWEDRNFSFDTPYDGKFSSQALSWYAGNRTKEFADQLIAKVRKFQKPEITALFKEINEKCRKDNTV